MISIPESMKIKLVAGSIGTFLISAFLSLDELRYLIWGRTVQGRVVESRRVEVQNQPMLSVQYSFADGSNGYLSERDLVSRDWALPTDGTINIEHIPGKPDTSRLAGHRNMDRVYIFLGSLAVIALFCLKLGLESRTPARKPSRRY